MPNKANAQLSSPTTLKTIEYVKKNAVPILTSTIFLGVVIGGFFAYNRWRKKTFAQRNASNPNVQAAMFIRRAVTKIDVLFFDVKLWTDEASIIKSAQKITDLNQVAKAYNIMYDADMMKDIQGLNNKELKIFFDIVARKKETRDLKKTFYHNGTTLYSVNEGILRVSKVKNENGKWKQTGEKYGSFDYNDEIGKVHTSVVYKQEPFSRFYIVEKGIYGFRDFGLVWDKDVTDRNY